MPSVPFVQPNLSEPIDLAVSRESRTAVYAAAWSGAIVIAFCLDRPLATFLHSNGIDSAVVNAGLIKRVIKWAGLFWYTMAVAAALAAWHPAHLRAAVFELLCGVTAGANALLKWLAGRTRPFKLPPMDLAQPYQFSPMLGGMRGLFHQSSNLSFVSGHAALAFATAAGLGVLLPRRNVFVVASYGAAIIVFAERVLENAHWLSDAVCAAALGVWGVMLLQRMMKTYIAPR